MRETNFPSFTQPFPHFSLGKAHSGSKAGGVQISMQPIRQYRNPPTNDQMGFVSTKATVPYRLSSRNNLVPDPKSYLSVVQLVLVQL